MAPKNTLANGLTKVLYRDISSTVSSKYTVKVNKENLPHPYTNWALLVVIVVLVHYSEEE